MFTLNSFNPLQVGYKPYLNPKCQDRQHCFNPLQVGYKRLSTDLGQVIHRLFQSLIGWLQTNPDWTSCWFYIYVSIPYRLATNEWKEYGEIYPEAVSIPYRLATNLRLQEFKCLVCRWFQSLIGWLQTSGMSRPTSIALSSFNPLQVGYKREKGAVLSLSLHRFNPLQVGYKRFPKLIVNDLANRFQSLIGWLQTIIPPRIYEKPVKFQSLIGWLQTEVYTGNHRLLSFVSIPYRLATNYIVPSDPTAGKEVSIPYRLATNLQQRQQQGATLQVSIPYRLATNYLH